MSTRLAFPFIILVAIGVACAQALEHTKDSLDVVKENLKAKKAVLVDVRERSEWDRGVLEGAILFALSVLNKESGSKELADQLAKQLPKDKIIYTHCRSGKRALSAAEILKKLGYQVRPLKPGYEELVKAGFKQAEGKK